jgi:hypothetical protein
MIGRIRGTTVLALAALVGMSPAGCSPNQTAPPRTSPMATPTMTPMPTATTGPSVDVSWEALPAFGFVGDIVRGSNGWLGAGACQACDSPALMAWFSSDAQVWSGYPLPRSRKTELAAVAASADGYLVAAYEQDVLGRDRIDRFLRFWRSATGRTWGRSGELKLGRCSDGCPFVGGIGLTPSGAIVVGGVSYEDARSTGPYVSDDAIAWSLVPASAFGFNDIRVRTIGSTPTGVALFGSVCPDCPTRAWRSADGRVWTEDGSIDAVAGFVSLAVDGSHRVAAVMDCPGGVKCALEAWTSEGDGPWTETLAGPDIEAAQVVSTDGGFVIVGLSQTTLAYVVFTSSDGSTWAQLPTGPGSDDNCGVAWLAGGPGNVVLGDPDCSYWRGTVR